MFAERAVHPLPQLRHLPLSLPVEGAIRIEIEEGVPIFRASQKVRTRIETLLIRQQEMPLTVEEEDELDRYEEIDDYLSFVNRLLRNVWITTDRANCGGPGDDCCVRPEPRARGQSSCC